MGYIPHLTEPECLPRPAMPQGALLAMTGCTNPIEFSFLVPEDTPVALFSEYRLEKINAQFLNEQGQFFSAAFCVDGCEVEEDKRMVDFSVEPNGDIPSLLVF